MAVGATQVQEWAFPSRRSVIAWCFRVVGGSFNLGIGLAASARIILIVDGGFQDLCFPGCKIQSLLHSLVGGGFFKFQHWATKRSWRGCENSIG